MHKKYPVRLTGTQRAKLRQLIASGTAPARRFAHARILLKADQSPTGPAWVDDAIAAALEISQSTVSQVRKQVVEQGMHAALNRRMPRRPYTRALDGVQAARLITIACSTPEL